MRWLACCIFLSLSGLVFAGQVTLVPPKGWDCVSDPEQLPQKVEVIYVGAGKSQFSPSLNIAHEQTDLSVEEYLAVARSYHEGQGDTQCQDLGKIETTAGPATLLRIDRTTQWGNVRFVQAVVLQGKDAYVITATCLQEEFASLSAQLFKAIQSFAIKGEPS